MKVYQRDYSLGGTNGGPSRSTPKQGVFHASNPEHPGQAACSEEIILVDPAVEHTDVAEQWKGFRLCRRPACKLLIFAPAPVMVLAYSVDASWSNSGSRNSKLHAAADQNNEYSMAACSSVIPLNVDISGYDPEQIRGELCQKPACQRRFFPDNFPAPTPTRYKPGLLAEAVAVRLIGKSDRRDGPPTSDRRAQRRRRRDEVNLREHQMDKARERNETRRMAKDNTTSSLIEMLIDERGHRQGWVMDIIRAEIDERIPRPRSTEED